mgnify:FL=1
MKLKRFRCSVCWTLEEMEAATKKKAPPFSILNPKQDKFARVTFDFDAEHGTATNAMFNWICRHHPCDMRACPEVWEKT